MKAKIKNIIFDLGVVLLDLNIDATVRAFERIGFSNFGDIYSQSKPTELFIKFDKGHITPDQFRNEVRAYIGSFLPGSIIEEAWNAMLGSIPADRMQLLQELKSDFKLFLLSNTNETHITEFETILSNEFGANAFQDCFEKIYYSCRAGMRKPDMDIYSLIIRENNLNPEETIFIDDTLVHVEGARKAGLTAFHLQPQQSVEELLFEIFEDQE
ncbi:MAG: HAD family phosphatase [Bacteroidetes bacterium]|nr:HAD family phosphatase [Bacteroidota bacterium]